MQASQKNDFVGTALTMHAPITADFGALKQRQQATWASGDYAVIGTTLQIVGEQLVEAMDMRAGWTVLDVAAGNGNATLAAARRFAQVTSTDYVPELLEKGKLRAQAEGLAVTFEAADAENLPYEDACFDAALSVFGSMFTPDHRRTADEMLRVVKPGGCIGVASWTPDGFIGQLFKVIGGFVPPPANVQAPPLWGLETHIVELFGNQADDIQTARRVFNFRYRSDRHWIEVFRNYYGPVLKAFASLDTEGQAALEAELLKLLGRFNIGGAHSLVVPGTYLEVVVTKHQ